MWTAGTGAQRPVVGAEQCMDLRADPRAPVKQCVVNPKPRPAEWPQCLQLRGVGLSRKIHKKCREKQSNQGTSAGEFAEPQNLDPGTFMNHSHHSFPTHLVRSHCVPGVVPGTGNLKPDKTGTAPVLVELLMGAGSGVN